MKFWPAQPEPGTPLWKRPAAWVLVAVVAVFGICGITVAIIVMGKDSPTVAKPAPSYTPDQITPPPDPGDISSDRVNDPPPTSTPNGWDWTPTTFANLSPNYVMALPSNSLYGPRLSDGPYKAGWDHSALGALGAASQLLLLTATDPREAQSHIVDGPNKATALQYSQTSHTIPNDIYPVYTGFKFLNYAPESASIQLLSSQGPTKKALLCTVNLQWADNDWRAQAGPGEDGVCMGSVQVDPPQPSFIDWGPAS